MNLLEIVSFVRIKMKGHLLIITKQKTKKKVMDSIHAMDMISPFSTPLHYYFPSLFALLSFLASSFLLPFNYFPSYDPHSFPLPLIVSVLALAFWSCTAFVR